MNYIGAVDPASGTSGGDSFAAAVAHAEEDGIGVLDGVRLWRPPFSPEAVVAEAAQWFGTYGITEIVGDRFSGEFVREAFRRHGVEYIPADRDKSQYFLEFLPLVTAGRVRLLDNTDLLRELRGLERRRGTSGRDRVDHRHGAHDDLANAVAIALVMSAGETTRVPFRMWGGEPDGRAVDAIQEEMEERQRGQAEESARMIEDGIKRGGGVWFPGD